MPNIIEKYIEMKKGFVILLSGPISKKIKKLGKKLAKKFGFNYINSNKYITQQNFNFVDLINVMDWDKLNEDIEKEYDKGVIVVGYLLPKDRINKTNYHIHLSVTRETYIDYRAKKINTQVIKNEQKDITNQLSEQNSAKIKDGFYQYKTISSTMFINKFVKIDSFTDRQIYERVFDIIIDYVMIVVYKK